MSWANKNGNFLLPVYCFDPRHYEKTYHFKFPKTGPHRLKFLIENIQDLRKTLNNKGRSVAVGKTYACILVSMFALSNICYDTD